MTTVTSEHKPWDAIRSLFAASGRMGPGPLLLAVSGGADSMALLHLAADARQPAREPVVRLAVATVDHRLRPSSAVEAAAVAVAAARLGLPHITLAWDGDKPATGIEASARAARYALLAGHARTIGATAIVTAHTADDQAETVLMRLARGSGLDGLAAMQETSAAHGVPLLRPLLGLERADLVRFLTARGISWMEDASNHDPQFERARLRQAHEHRAALSLTSEGLSRSARRLSRAREALELLTTTCALAISRADAAGGVTLDARGWRAQPAELRLRLLARAIHFVTGDDAPINLAQLEAAEAALSADAPAGRTLHGACLTPRTSTLVVTREVGREGLPRLLLAPGTSAVWDRRFHLELSAAAAAGVEVRAAHAAELVAMFDAMRSSNPAAQGTRDPVFSRVTPVFFAAGAPAPIAAPSLGVPHPHVACTLLRSWPDLRPARPPKNQADHPP